VHISSTRIRELAMFGRRLENFVPKEIEDEVYSKLFEHYKRNGLAKMSHHQQQTP
jgi:ATP sulfurylase